MVLLRDLVPDVPDSVGGRQVGAYWVSPTESAARERAQWYGELLGGLMWVCPVVMSDQRPREWGCFVLQAEQEVERWR